MTASQPSYHPIAMLRRANVCLLAVLLGMSAQALGAEKTLKLRYGDKKVELSQAEFAKLKPTEV